MADDLLIDCAVYGMKNNDAAKKSLDPNGTLPNLEAKLGNTGRSG